MTPRPTLLLCTACCILSACEKVDLGTVESGTTEVEHIVPHSVGMGTQEAPYTVEQVLEGKDIEQGPRWVIGYVVGSTYRSMSNAIFAAETSYTSNILIADEAQCTSTQECIAVELSSASVQRALGLASDSTRFRQCIMVEGTANRYFSQNGLRNVLTGYFLPGFDLQAINPHPTEWEEWKEDF